MGDVRTNGYKTRLKRAGDFIRTMSDALSSGEPIGMVKWTAMDDRMRMALLVPPLREVLNDPDLRELSRLGRFMPGMRVRKESQDWLDKTFRRARQEWKRMNRGSDTDTGLAEA